jgi:hypothetical protein
MPGAGAIHPICLAPNCRNLSIFQQTKSAARDLGEPTLNRPRSTRVRDGRGSFGLLGVFGLLICSMTAGSNSLRVWPEAPRLICDILETFRITCTQSPTKSAAPMGGRALASHSAPIIGDARLADERLRSLGLASGWWPRPQKFQRLVVAVRRCTAPDV